MSKILHKCLSMVLVVILLASLSVVNPLNASADNKTGDGLAAYAIQAYNEGWQYVWGGASPGSVDCSGLIYSYVEGGARVTEDMLYSSPESGYVSDGVPDIPGLGLWQPGHVGVYVGNGMAVDARDEISNVCYQSVATKSWVMWFKVNGVSYGTDSSVTNDDSANQQDDTEYEEDSETDFLQEYELSAVTTEEIQDDTVEDNFSFDNSEKNVNIPTVSNTEQSESDYNDIPQQDLYEDFDSSKENTSELTYPDAIYQYGDMGEDISNIQFMLLKLGYYDYLISGEYDKNTVDSVRMFQLDYKLDFTGAINEEALTTLYKVYDDSKKLRQPSSANSDEKKETLEEIEEKIDSIPDTDSFLENDNDESLSLNEEITVNKVEYILPSKADGSSDSISTKSDNSKNTEIDSSTDHKSPKTGNPTFWSFLSHWQEYMDKTFILAVIIFSVIVIFFAGTVHYWNISMEKRKQRLKKDITAPIYKRRSM